MTFVCLSAAFDASAQTRGWAYNGDGQLGIGNFFDQPSPVIVSASDAGGIGGGYTHTVFLKTDGTLAASGFNDYGQLGDGTTVATGCFCTTTPA